ncbi:MAG: hypothetical protein AB1805_04825 [Nitrospirota bacterium]
MDKAVLLMTGLLLLPLGDAALLSRADAEVSINIGIGAPLPPPVIVVERPPEVVLIPGTRVYFAPDIGDSELFFYSGYWYRRHGSAWYRAARYDGSWIHLPPRRVPVVFVKLPKGYHRDYDRHERMPYGKLKKEWKKAEREHRKHEKERHRNKRDHDD